MDSGARIAREMSTFHTNTVFRCETQNEGWLQYFKAHSSKTSLGLATKSGILTEKRLSEAF